MLCSCTVFYRQRSIYIARIYTALCRFLNSGLARLVASSPTTGFKYQNVNIICYTIMLEWSKSIRV